MWKKFCIENDTSSDKKQYLKPLYNINMGFYYQKVGSKFDSDHNCFC